jgi:hypothetical protein
MINNDGICTLSLIHLPVDVMRIIINECTILEMHVLRFLCHKLHFMMHNEGKSLRYIGDGSLCRSLRKSNFWISLENGIKKSIHFMASERGYFNILKWITGFIEIDDKEKKKKNLLSISCKNGHLLRLAFRFSNQYLNQYQNGRCIP